MNYFVYVYNDNDGVPYYVGKGNRNRHLYRRRKSVSPPLREYIQVFTCSSEQEAYELEISLIEFFGRKLDGGSLENLSKGGPGCKGYYAPRINGIKPRKKRLKAKCPPTPSILDRPSFNV